jgi:methyl-accepting chemotaxis protein
MNEENIALVRQSWQQLQAAAPQAGQLFYRNLFSAAPWLEPLFKTKLADQAARLMQMIGAAVDRLDDAGMLEAALQGLGRSHAVYGVRDAHYEPVGAALLETLAQGLGDAFTPPVKQAWAEVYGVMANVMAAAGHATA